MDSSLRICNPGLLAEFRPAGFFQEVFMEVLRDFWRSFVPRCFQEVLVKFLLEIRLRFLSLFLPELLLEVFDDSTRCSSWGFQLMHLGVFLRVPFDISLQYSYVWFLREVFPGFRFFFCSSYWYFSQSIFWKFWEKLMQTFCISTYCRNPGRISGRNTGINQRGTKRVNLSCLRVSKSSLDCWVLHT